MGWPVSYPLMQSFAALTVLLLTGHALRKGVRLLGALHLPSCVVAGVLGLAVLQAVGASDRASEYVSREWLAGWKELPGFLINIVFACLFLGIEVPPLREVWRLAGPQFVYGQVVAWGNWAIAATLGAGIGSAFAMHRAFGSVLPVGFEGGHGTAAGLGPSYAQIGCDDCEGIALFAATLGITAGVLVGMGLVNWRARDGSWLARRATRDGELSAAALLLPPAQQPLPRVSIGEGRRQHDAGAPADAAGDGALFGRRSSILPNDGGDAPIEPLAFHLALVGLAVLLGYLTKAALVAAQRAWPWADDKKFFESFPVFPLAMLYGMAIQAALARRAATARAVDRAAAAGLAALCLDYLITASVSTIDVRGVAGGVAPFLLLMCAGLAWHLACFCVIAPRMLPDYWFPRALAKIGQSLGVVPTGLMLLRAVDPHNQTPALAAFSYACMLQEPFMGGGLWTSTAVLLMDSAGPWAILGVSAAAIAANLAVFRFLLLPGFPGRAPAAAAEMRESDTRLVVPDAVRYM